MFFLFNYDSNLGLAERQISQGGVSSTFHSVSGSLPSLCNPSIWYRAKNIWTWEFPDKWL